MTAEIELPCGKAVPIDREDLWLVQQHRWYAASHNTHTWYAVAGTGLPDGRRAWVYMHRLILGLTDPSVLVDHISGDGLDNRRVNLRTCSRSENARNSRKRVNNTSGFKGVSWQKGRGKWKAQISVAGKNRHLGLFNTAAEAHSAYCRAADELHGEFRNYGDTA